MFQEFSIKTKQVMLMTVSLTEAFFSNQGDVTLTLMVQYGKSLNVGGLIHVHLICKFPEDVIKSE